MPLKLIKRGDFFYLRGTVRGKSIYEACGTDNKEAAEAIRAQREARLLQDSVFGASATVTFAEAVLSYLESGGSRRHIGTQDTGLLKHFYDRKLRTISQSDLDAAARMLYPTAQPETRNRHCYTPFIAVWNHAVRNGWADVRQWSRPRKAKGTPSQRVQRAGAFPVSYDKAALFIAHMSPAAAMLMTTLFYTGMRPIELFALQAADVRVKARWIVVRSSKTGEPRGVPMHEFLVPVFESLTAEPGHVFRTHFGEPYPINEDFGGQISSAIEGARRRSGITGISPYTGRHSVSTQLVINGVHPYIKDQILGHAADSMSRHYTSVPQEPLIEAINTLPVPDAMRAMWWLADPLGSRRKLVKWGKKGIAETRAKSVHGV